MTVSQPFNVSIETVGGYAYIRWTAPTTYDDNVTPLTVANYGIFASQDDPTGADYSVEITAAEANAYPTPPGYSWYHPDFNRNETWYFWVTARDASGVESVVSNVSSKVF